MATTTCFATPTTIMSATSVATTEAETEAETEEEARGAELG
jgi:hypothetical protein